MQQLKPRALRGLICGTISLSSLVDGFFPLVVELFKAFHVKIPRIGRLIMKVLIFDAQRTSLANSQVVWLVLVCDGVRVSRVNTLSLGCKAI